MPFEKYLFLTFPDFNSLVIELFIAYNKKYSSPPDYIISIQRGGAVMSKILSDFFDKPIVPITVKSYSGKKTNPVELTQDLPIAIQNSRLLVVDEISDTGKTFNYVESYLKSKQPKEIVTAALFVKPHSTYLPDIYVSTTEKWIIFPYELKELFTMLTDEKIEDDELAFLKEYFLANGVSEKLLNEFSQKPTTA